MEVASNLFANGVATTNLPATIATDSSMIALDERYVPYDAKPGEGFITGASTYSGGLLKCLQATASAASSITGQASGGDATVLANEYRNFQIRIVEDTTTPTSVNQRRIIASHTVGASPVYTLGSAWTVQPSATAKFVIEYPNLILLRSSATTNVYVYNYSPLSITNGTGTIAAGNWSVTYFGVAPAAMAAGCMQIPSFGIRPSGDKLTRHSMIYNFRGTSAVMDVLDIAGAIAGTWETAAVYDGSMTFSAFCPHSYAPFDGEGRFGYINNYVASTVNQIYRFDVQNRVLSPYTPTDFVQAGTAVVGNRLATYAAIDGTDKYTALNIVSHLSTLSMELINLI
jgi:hypothetical protein